jgi:hypothetical protein
MLPINKAILMESRPSRNFLSPRFFFIFVLFFKYTNLNRT